MEKPKPKEKRKIKGSKDARPKGWTGWLTKSPVPVRRSGSAAKPRSSQLEGPTKKQKRPAKKPFLPDLELEPSHEEPMLTAGIADQLTAGIADQLAGLGLEPRVEAQARFLLLEIH